MEKRIKLNLKSELEAGEIAKLVQIANNYSSVIYIEMEDSHRINAKSIMGMMNFLAVSGKEVVIKAEGTDEKEVIEVLASVLTGKE